ncbi:MAG: toll/interleukin-1 receptor domain-containing protein [Chloroflexota bacterium]
MQFHAFLSYSHKDRDIMRRVRHDLGAMGLNIWSDENLVPGTASWKDAIEEAIQQSLTLVVLLSPDAKRSEWIEREIEYARACDVKVIPVLARGSHDISTIPFELINVQRIDLRADYTAGLRQLAETIQSEGTLDAQPSNPVVHGSGNVIERLNPNSFYDHVRLFVWIFWQPQKLIVYQERYDDDSLRQTTAWVVGNLVWVAMLAPAIGYVLGLVTVEGANPETASILQALAGVVFFLCWFLTGWIGWREEQQYAAVLLLPVTLLVAGTFYVVATYSNVILSQGEGFSGSIFLILTGILISTGAGIGFRITPPVVGSVAGIILGSLLFNAFTNTQLGIAGGVMAFIMFVTTILVAWVVDNSLKTGTRTPFHMIALGWVGFGGGGLIFVYFLGGWLLLRGI